MKAIVITCGDAVAEDVARLLASALTLNGYQHDGPAVIDWPVGRCCDLHQAEGCCDQDDCGPCCGECPTCPTLRRQRLRAVKQ